MGGVDRYQLYRELHVPVQAYCDARSVVDALYTSKWSIRSKRRRVDLASIKEAHDVDGAITSWCSTDKMVSDGLTKTPVGLLLENLLRVMRGLVNLPFR